MLLLFTSQGGCLLHRSIGPLLSKQLKFVVVVVVVVAVGSWYCNLMTSFASNSSPTAFSATIIFKTWNKIIKSVSTLERHNSHLLMTVTHIELSVTVTILCHKTMCRFAVQPLSTCLLSYPFVHPLYRHQIPIPDIRLASPRVSSN